MTPFNMHRPAKLLASAVSALCFVLLFDATADQGDREHRQLALDQVCESARAQKLAPLRQQFVDECISERGKDKADCERFYSDYGERSGDRAPLFYDLPECVEAFDYRRSYRRAK